MAVLLVAVALIKIERAVAVARRISKFLTCALVVQVIFYFGRFSHRINTKLFYDIVTKMTEHFYESLEIDCGGSADVGA